MGERIKVLIVDDSAVVRQVLEEIFASDPAMEVVGSARDPFVAAEIMRNVVPDVITLDVEMPRMDGVTFLHKLMRQRPLPVVMCSSLTEKNSETALRALEYGAIDIIEKPKMGVKQYLQESKVLICDTVKAAAQARIGNMKKTAMKVEPKLSADAMLEKPLSRAMIQTTDRVVVVGASTGGTEALKCFLQALPLDSPGVVVVQHMPEHFTAAFAKRLDGVCKVSVKEASDDDTVVRGRVLIAPGNRHTLLKRSGARYYVEVKEGPLVSRHRPSVDVLFRSAARYAGKNALAVIMTGMGDDGARGMLEMKEAGAYTIAQDEASCVVFGMPKEAIKMDAVDSVVSLDNIARIVMRQCNI